MPVAILLGLLLLCKNLRAGFLPSAVNNRPCIDLMLPIPATAQHTEDNNIHVNNNIDAAAWAVSIDTWSFNEASHVRNFTVSGTYNISAQLCVPPDRSKRQHLIIATHGAFVDKGYWDVAINRPEYSFVDAAIEAGYSILTYDRLGSGLSEKPDAYTVVQAPIQREILREITNFARSGEIFKHTSSALGTTNETKSNASTTSFETSKVTFDKIIHVSHSFGSILTSLFLSTYGNESDAAVLTGFIENVHLAELRKTSADLEYAPQSDPTLFGDRTSGYMVGGTVSSFQAGFFSTQTNATTGVGGFDPEVLEYAFSTRGTATTSEFGALPVDFAPAEAFQGPLQYVLGEFDFGVCRGDCRIDFTAVRELYPKAKDVDIYTQPGTGHALTLHRKANLGYKATFDWLGRNGL